MDMTSLNISLPEPMKAFVESQIAEGGYSTASEYIRALIREAQKRKADEALEALLLEGLGPQQGTVIEWEERKRRFRERRLEQLRQEIALGVEELERGEGIPAEEVFKKLRERNRQTLRPAK
jgi:antitoxin ParD1/3/4